MFTEAVSQKTPKETAAAGADRYMVQVISGSPPDKRSSYRGLQTPEPQMNETIRFVLETPVGNMDLNFSGAEGDTQYLTPYRSDQRLSLSQVGSPHPANVGALSKFILKSRAGDIELMPSRSTDDKHPSVESKTVYLTPSKLRRGKPVEDSSSVHKSVADISSVHSANAESRSGTVPWYGQTPDLDYLPVQTATSNPPARRSDPRDHRSKVSDANQRTGPFNIHNPVASLVSPELTSSAQKQFLARAFLPPMAQRARNSNDTGHLRDFSAPGIMQTPAKERGDDAKRTAGGTVLQNRRTSEADPREVDGVRIDVKTSPSDVRSSPDLSVPLLSSHPGIFSPPGLGRRQSTAVATQTTVMSTSERRKGDAENPATNRLTEMERALELLSSAFADAQSQAPEERAKTRDAALSAYHLNEMPSHAANQSVYTVQTVSQDSTMTSPYLMSPELGEDDRGKDPRAADEEEDMEWRLVPFLQPTHEQQKRSPIFSMRSRIEQRTSEAVSKWTRKSPPDMVLARGEASSMSVNPERIQSPIPPARRSPMPAADIELPAEHTMRFAVPSNVLQPRSPSSLLRSSPTHGYSVRSHQPTATPPKFVYEAGGDYALSPAIHTPRIFTSTWDDFSAPQMPSLRRVDVPSVSLGTRVEAGGSGHRRRISQDLLTVADDFSQPTIEANRRSRFSSMSELVGTGFSDYQVSAAQTRSISPPAAGYRQADLDRGERMQVWS